jgi:hypothetical protein
MQLITNWMLVSDYFVLGLFPILMLIPIVFLIFGLVSLTHVLSKMGLSVRADDTFRATSAAVFSGALFTVGEDLLAYKVILLILLIWAGFVSPKNAAFTSLCALIVLLVTIAIFEGAYAPAQMS